MASNGLTNLLKRIDEANANISGKLGTLDTHITAIIAAGNALLAKIKSGVLLPDQIAQIRGKLNSLREKTLANVGSKNTRIQELEELFTQLLGASPPKTDPLNAGNPLSNYAKNLLFYEGPKIPNSYKVVTGQGYENAKNIRSRMNAQALQNNAERERKKAELQQLISTQQAQNIRSRMNAQALQNNVERERKKTDLQELQRLAANQQAQIEQSSNPFEPLNPANSNPEQVLAKINAIPDSKSATTNNAKKRVQNIVEAIQAVQVFLKQMPNEISNGLLDYIDQRYRVDPRSLIGVDPRSLISEMGTKHKPVLKYIVSLAGDLASFTKGIKRPTGIFPKSDLSVQTKSDLSVRIDILTAVIAKLPEEKTTEELKNYLFSLQDEYQTLAQSGGKRKTRCGCGLKGGRRTRKAKRATRTIKK